MDAITAKLADAAAQSAQAVNPRLLKKSQDMMQQQASALVEALPPPPPPPSVPGLGGQVDVKA